MRYWTLVRPWLGLTLAIYETMQPLFGRVVEPLIVGLAGTMMAAELAAQAFSKKDKETKESSE